MTSTTSSPRPTIRIGVFIPADCQLLDMACVDIFGTSSYEYISVVKDLVSVPSAMLNLAPSVQISYISTIPPGALISTTSNARLACSHHLSDAAVQPGQLDIVLVPGPDPTTDWHATDDRKQALTWLAAHAARPETDILSVCTGIYVCGAAGLLQGKKACGPRGLQGDLRKRFEGAQWVGDELRWVRDGNFWSCGGVISGNDLVAAYLRTSGRFPGPIAEFGLMLTETALRPQKYETGKTVFTLGIVWQVLKAVLMGLGKKKTA